MTSEAAGTEDNEVHGQAPASVGVHAGATSAVACLPCHPRSLACSSTAAVLGIDTSHFSVLARLAAALADRPEGVPTGEDANFKDLVRRHACRGARRCVVSKEELDDELLPVDGWPRTYAPGIHADAFDGVEVASAGDVSRFSPGPPESVGPVDQTLVGAVLTAADADDQELAGLVTNDQRLYEWIADLVEQGWQVLPFHSVSFLVNMVRCGALTDIEAVLAFSAETTHLDHYDRPMSARLRREKEEQIRLATNAVAAMGTRAARVRP